jgi:plastocyanin
MFRTLGLLLVAFALLAAACSSGDDDVSSGTTVAPTTEATDETDASGGDSGASENPDGETDDGETDDGETDRVPDADGAAILADYQRAAELVELPEGDASLPPSNPDGPTGAYGYSRYVYQASSGDVVPALIEGPLGEQVRCQDLDKDCSYGELKALYDSGDDVPDYLGMDRETLGELVDQLDRVNAAVMSYETIDDACAAGFFKSTNQNANMGIHMMDPTAGSIAFGGEFNPDKPQMVLFAKDGGEQLDGSEIGGCVDGAWTGEDGFEPVGAVFNLNLADEHPDGFAGPIDNWHIHYNTCISRNAANAVEGSDMGEGAAVTAEQCSNAGGQFIPLIPSWMMHAYVADGFEAQAGVFSMFNPSVWPVMDTTTLEDSRLQRSDADVDAPINNFDYGNIEAEVGETIRFSNSDSVPHTVTAGSAAAVSGAFDSGVLGTGQAFDLSFEEAGTYELFCALHPAMTATITVG